MHLGKLEFLALNLAVSERFRDYLYYAPHFVVFTDNNPLIYVLTTAKLNATSHKRVGELVDFIFTIRYRPDKRNVDANGLSRFPPDNQQYMVQSTAEIKQDIIRAAVENAVHQNKSPLPKTIVVNQSAVSLVQDTIPLATEKPFSQEEIRDQFLLPKEHHNTVFREGTLGVQRTLGLIRDRFYWPRM